MWPRKIFSRKMLRAAIKKRQAQLIFGPMQSPRRRGEHIPSAGRNFHQVQCAIARNIRDSALQQATMHSVAAEEAIDPAQ